MVIWLIGLSGAGKTTIGREVWRQWKSLAPNVAFIDGDEVREIFRDDSAQDAHTLAGRRLNAERITALNAMLDRQGIHVVCSILSIFPDLRVGSRYLYSAYFEVFVDTPMAILEARDGKGLYAAARAGTLKNVVGVDIPFPRPEHADLVIENKQEEEPGLIAERILRAAGIAHG